MKRLLLFAALVAWSGIAGAVVYKWVDAQGKLQYGDRPPVGVHAEVVELLGTHVARSATARASESAPAANTANKRDQPNQGDAAAKKAISDDVAQVREKQCAEAQDRYKKLIEGRRLYKTGTNGERQYLTSEEIDSERLNAKREVDTTCNSPT
jgi:Domain of unknown function (DUF4124)